MSNDPMVLAIGILGIAVAVLAIAQVLRHSEPRHPPHELPPYVPPQHWRSPLTPQERSDLIEEAHRLSKEGEALHVEAKAALGRNLTAEERALLAAEAYRALIRSRALYTAPPPKTTAAESARYMETLRRRAEGQE